MVGLLLIALAGQATAGPAPYAKFTGEVTHGRSFEREFGSGLVFRLAANADSGPPGWTIEVRPRGAKDPEVELIFPVTPPYRFWNPRYLDVSYGMTARQAVETNPRQFSFLRNPGDFPRTVAAVRTLLWPGNTPREEQDRAGRLVDESLQCSGTLRILDSRIGRNAGPDGAPEERIDWLKFEVELCPGADQTRLIELPPKSRAYESTQGQIVDSRWAPYLESYAADHDIILNKILVPLMPANPRRSSTPWYVSSRRRLEPRGNWTYFRSDSVILFDLLKLRCGQGDEAFVALYNVTAGEARGWRMAVLKSDYTVARTHDLSALSRSSEWESNELTGDMIYADLGVSNNTLAARVTYVLTGSGGFPEQGFEFGFRQEGSSCSALVPGGVRQIR